MIISAAEKIDAVNIGLMLVSCVVAILIPLELFLFSYAVLGPLHYLTEISWLHDRHYFAKGRYDALWLVIIGLVTTLAYYSTLGIVSLEFPEKIMLNLAYIGLLSGAVFAFIKNTFLRIGCILLIIVTSQVSEHFVMIFGVFLPTLIHVYVFTGLFMLYGALKSKSRLGILSVICLIICPFILVFMFPDFHPLGLTSAGQKMYAGENETGFIMLHKAMLFQYFNVHPVPGTNQAEFWIQQVFYSRTGILLMRFIAFAYTYHYLNWFSKTSVIQWHKVTKQRFALVVVFWIISVGLYIYSYSIGLIWLFFLSYLHVLLEFPLNFTSIQGIGKYFQQKFFKPSARPA